MPERRAPAVLHLTAAIGGGADRYIRDLASSTCRRHFVLHVGAKIDVIEDVHARRYTPIRARLGSGSHAQAVSRWLDLAGVGLVHLHGVDEMCRERLATLLRARELPYVITLHDVMFVNPRAFHIQRAPSLDAAWIDAVRPMLLGAKSVIASSSFVAEMAAQSNPGIRIALIPPGIRSVEPVPNLQAPADFVAQAPAHVVAIVGAVGPHKGSAIVDELPTALAGSDIGIVLIGYTDTELARRWIVPGRFFMHGPYVDDELGGLLAAYRAEIVLFPNRMPETFSYTLSEVWASGVPVIVPDEGALGERVARQDGGWRLPPGYGSADAAALLARLFSIDGAAERARVKSSLASIDVQRIPSLEAMSRDVEALYDRFAQPIDASEPDVAHEALAPLLAANLDGFAFRKELVKLTGELAQVKSRLAEVSQWSAKLERDVRDVQLATLDAEQKLAASIAWASKLEDDVKASNAAASKLDDDVKASNAWARKLEADIALLRGEIERLAEPSAAFALLPEFIQKLMKKRLARERH